MGALLLNRTGLRYGNLVVLRYTGKNDNNGRLWECRCDCGVIKVIPGKNLSGGRVKSCGCSRRKPRLKTSISMMGNRNNTGKTREPRPKPPKGVDHKKMLRYLAKSVEKNSYKSLEIAKSASYLMFIEASPEEQAKKMRIIQHIYK